MTSYIDRLHEAVERTQNPSVVGLDPHLALLPDEFAVCRDGSAPRAERAAAVESFLRGIIDAAADLVPAVKPQSAFFEALGADGVLAFERVVAHAKGAGLLVIGDVKRGDIGSTAAAYAEAFLTGVAGTDPRTLCDSITVNPYLGADSIEPFVRACREADAGLYVLVRTSNPSSDDFQTLVIQGGAAVSGEDPGEDRLCEAVADAVRSWGSELVGSSGWSSIGAVVGATHPGELAALRSRMPGVPLLLPGYGAQGATAGDLIGAFDGSAGRPLLGALVNSSRGILFAGRERPELHWKDAARGAMEAMASELRDALLP